MVNGPTTQTALPTNPAQMQGIQPKRPTAPTAPATTPQAPAQNKLAAPPLSRTNGLDQVQISQQAVRAMAAGPGTAANAPTQPGLARNMNNAQGPTNPVTYSRPAPRAATNNVTANQQQNPPAQPAPPTYTPTQDLAPGQSLNVMA